LQETIRPVAYKMTKRIGISKMCIGNKMIVALIKDRELAAKIKESIRAADENADILITDSPDMAYKVIRHKKVALLIADMEAGEQGKERNLVSQMIIQLRKNRLFLFLPVILLAKSDEYRIQAFCEWNCMGYYSEPVCMKDFSKKAGHILQAQLPDEQENMFVIRRHNVRYPVKVGELIYVRYFERALHLYMSSGDVFIVDQRPVQMILDLAQARSIIKCGRGTLVNLTYVTEIDFGKKEIRLRNGDVVKLGEAYEKELKEAWLEIDIM